MYSLTDARYDIKNLIARFERLIFGDDTEPPAYLLSETIYFTESDTFDKADYPGLRAVRVKCQGGGGGGGGVPNPSAGQLNAGGSGYGGDYAESLILVSALDASETVTVGAGGDAGSASGTGTAGEGGDSSFGSHVVAGGGRGGINNRMPTGTSQTIIHGVISQDSTASTSVGDLIVPGGKSGNLLRLDGSTGQSAHGGDSHLGSGAGERTINDGHEAVSGEGYGAGGRGAGRRNNLGGRSGSAGTDGVVIIELYK